MRTRQYERPAIRDYGSLLELTEATNFCYTEDGGAKTVVHHSSPCGP